jgi:hypothetical protein
MRLLGDSWVEFFAWLTAFALFAGWPPVCISIGDTYEAIARARDVGVKREEIAKIAAAKGMKIIVDQIYEAPNINPEQWKHIAIGTCMGILKDDERRDTRTPKKVIGS